MTVEIEIFYYGRQHIFKRLVDTLKDKNPIIIKEDIFTIDLELNVNSFDEVIYLLEKYNSEIEITLSVYSTNEVKVWIGSRSETCSLGNQVE